MCPLCGKTFKGLRQHMMKSHEVDTRPVVPSATDQRDCVHEYWTQLIRLLLIRSALTAAVHAGDGDVLCRVIKYLHLYFRRLGYPKYALATFEYVAQVQLFLSPQQRETLMYERFVNRQGRPGCNMPFDLDVEHSNKVFKQFFTLHRGEPTDQMVRRISASQDIISQLIQVHTDNWQTNATIRSSRRRNEETYQSDVEVLAKRLGELEVLSPTPGRRFHLDTLNNASHDPLQTIDMHALRLWYCTRLKDMSRRPYFHH